MFVPSFVKDGEMLLSLNEVHTHTHTHTLRQYDNLITLLFDFKEGQPLSALNTSSYNECY